MGGGVGQPPQQPEAYPRTPGPPYSSLSPIAERRGRELPSKLRRHGNDRQANERGNERMKKTPANPLGLFFVSLV